MTPPSQPPGPEQPPGPPEPGGAAEGVPYCYRHPDRETYIRCQRCARPICPDCMREAAVGFQCPQCVAEGRRQTRSGRTAYGGLRPTNASITSGVIIGINVAVFVLLQAFPDLLYRLALSPVGVCDAGDGYVFSRAVNTMTCDIAGGTWVPGVSDGAWWQLVTSAFSHTALLHIGFNMLALWVLGPQLEMAVGRARFLGLYLLSVLAGSAFVYALASPWSTTLGASGGVFGLMAALLVAVVKVGGDPRGILFWVGLNVVITVFGGGISWQGHLGGFIGGLVVAIGLMYAPRGPRRTLVQVSTMAAVLVVVLASFVVTTLSY